MKLRTRQRGEAAYHETSSDDEDAENDVDEYLPEEEGRQGKSGPTAKNAKPSGAGASSSRQPKPKITKKRPAKREVESRCPDLLPLVLETCGRHDLFPKAALRALRATSKSLKELLERMFPLNKVSCHSTDLEKLLDCTSLMERLEGLTISGKPGVIETTQFVVSSPRNLKELKFVDIGAMVEILTCGRFSSLTCLVLHNINTQTKTLKRFGAIEAWPLQVLELKGTGATVSQSALFSVIERFPELTSLRLSDMRVKRTLSRGYKAPPTFLHNLKELKLNLLINLHLLELSRFFRGPAEAGMPSLRKLAVTSNKKSVLQDLTTAKKWVKNLKCLELFHKTRSSQWEHRLEGSEESNSAAYRQFFTSFQGGKLQILRLHIEVFDETVMQCLDLPFLAQLEVTYDPHLNPEFVTHLCTAKLPALSSLTLKYRDSSWQHAPYNISGLNGLKTAFPNLSRVSLTDFQSMSDKTLQDIGRYVMPFVEELEVSRCALRGDRFKTLMSYLNESCHVSQALCPKLRVLKTATAISNALDTLSHFAHHLPNLRSLNLASGTPGTVTPEMFDEMKKKLAGSWPYLRQLCVGSVLADSVQSLWPLARVT